MTNAFEPRPGSEPDAAEAARGRGNSQQKFVQVLHDLDAVVWEMDAQTWRFTYVSPRAERMFGYPLADWYEDPEFWQGRLVHPEDREWCVRYCSTASGECRNHAFLYRAITADGEVRWIKDVVRVIADDQGRPSVMRGVMLAVGDDAAESRHIRSTALDYDADELEELRSILAA